MLRLPAHRRRARPVVRRVSSRARRRTLRPALSCALFLGAASLPVHAARPVLSGIYPVAFTATTDPAIGDVNGDNRPDIIATSDHIGDISRGLSDDPNRNYVAAYTWDNGLRLLPHWPARTRDAVTGLALGDLDADGLPEVVAACGQDAAPPEYVQQGNSLVSRLYVWRGGADPVRPWCPWDPNSASGLAVGHAYAAPVLADLDGRPGFEIIQGSQGVWTGTAFRSGSLSIWSAQGALMARTQSENLNAPWYTTATFAVDQCVAIADLTGAGRRNVVAASFDGQLYAWNPDGTPAPGWFPTPGAGTRVQGDSIVRTPPTAVDLNGDGRDEILVAAYDGFLYCWSPGGAFRWRRGVSLPSGETRPPLTSGVSAAPLTAGNPVDWLLAMGDAQGNVLAFDGIGRLRWKAATTPGYAVFGEPALGDVDNDGVCDVVAGGTDGKVYAWDGATGRLLWSVPTYPALTLNGPKNESVYGSPALTDLQGDGRLDVVVCTGLRYYNPVAHAWQGYGHVLVFECGPDTYHVERNGWPQFRRNSARTGGAQRLRDSQYGPWGDADGDGRVTMADARLVAGFLKDPEAIPAARRERIRFYGDVEGMAIRTVAGDGTLGEDDVTRVQRILGGVEEAGPVGRCYDHYGDADGDGAVSVVDAVLVQRSRWGLCDPAQEPRVRAPGMGDVFPTRTGLMRGDGVLDGADVFRIEQRADGTEPLPLTAADYGPM